MLLAQDISLERSKKVIFENISLSIGSGKILALKGKNGSGKTSLLKTILYILEPSSGKIYWKNKLLKNNLYDFYNTITYIADKTSSLRQLTVYENINIWKKLFVSNIGKDQIDNILIALNLNDYSEKKVNSLSLGEVKKLELLRLIIENKKIWILDEPLTNLDTETIDVLSQTFEDHIKNEGSIIFSSHQNLSINISEEIVL